VHRDEIRTRNAVAIEKHAEFAPSFQDRPVPDLRRAKSVVWLPYMRKPFESRGPGFHQLRGGRSRTVVSDNDLEIPVSLPGEGAQYSRERILSVVGRHHDGDQLSHCPSLVIPAKAGCSFEGTIWIAAVRECAGTASNLVVNRMPSKCAGSFIVELGALRFRLARQFLA
jgi:hypothetical protein